MTPQAAVEASPNVTTVRHRELDLAADKELKEAFGVFREQRDAARIKYASQRWRFRAKVSDVLTGFALVRPVGLDPVSLHFASEQEVARVHKQSEYLFEATIEDWLSRHMVDGVIVADDASNNP